MYGSWKINGCKPVHETEVKLFKKGPQEWESLDTLNCLSICNVSSLRYERLMGAILYTGQKWNLFKQNLRRRRPSYLKLYVNMQYTALFVLLSTLSLSFFLCNEMCLNVSRSWNSTLNSSPVIKSLPKATFCLAFKTLKICLQPFHMLIPRSSWSRRKHQ